MKVVYLLAGVAGFIGLAVAGVAVAANMTSSHHSDFYSPGKHQFYVWCAGGTDSMVWEQGANAEDAQSRLYASEKAAGHDKCWPVWQGRVAD